MSDHYINHHQNLSRAVKCLNEVHTEIANSGVENRLANLIMLRASQINGCAYCVNMHTSDARKAGETDARLDHLVVWQHVDHFTDAERAALAWTEHLTRLNSRTPNALKMNLKTHFSEQTISGITFLIGMINMWNRIGVSNHS